MKSIVMVMCLAGLVSFQSNAQDSTKNIKAMLDSKTFTFQPTNMNPSVGRTRTLDYGYSLQVKGDSVMAYLPYFGRAYSAPINSNDAGINFTSTNFSYVVSNAKKKGYTVVIATKDRTYNTTFTLTAFDNGTAYLQVISSDKQQISYNGNIK